MVMNRSRIGGSILTPGSQARNVVGGKTYTPAASYPSSSNAGKNYIVCEVSDGTTSCGCMGWTRRNPPGGRTCKHTQDYEQFLRPLWNNLHTGQAPVGVPHQLYPVRITVPEPAVQATDKEKGGNLSELLAKLEREDAHGRG